MTKYVVCDIENNNVPWYGHKAGSPQCPDNYIVAVAWQDIEGGTVHPVQERYFNSREEAEAGEDWFSLMLTDCDVLVAHNSLHEMSYFIERYHDKFLTFLKRGGRVWCTAVGHYLLSQQLDLYPSLNEIAPAYGGTQKVDGVKILWEQGVLTKDIDRALLMEYLAGPNGDVENTTRVFLGQLQQLRQRGLLNNYMERCEGAIAYAFCMQAGLHVDMEAFEVEQERQRKKLSVIDQQIKTLLPKDLPFEFNWGSMYHRSAALYGGSVKYKCKVSYNPTKWEKADFYKRVHDGKLIRCEVADNAPENMPEVVLYSSGKNKGLPKVFRGDTDVEKFKWGEAYYTFKALVDLCKLPKEGRDKFHAPAKGRSGEWVTALKLPDGSPVLSSSGETLEYLAAHGFTAGKLLADRMGIVKDLSSFYEGLEPFIQPDHIVHHSLNITSTVTGRLSAKQPNMQQLPRADQDDATGEEKSRVKRVYNSRWGEHGRIIACDYSNLETVMNCAMSGDYKLLQALLDGVDIHCLRLAYKLKEDYTEVKTKCKDDTHPDHERYKVLRTDIKSVGFASTYGASATGLAYSCGVSLEFANEFLDNEAKLWPDMIKFRQTMKDMVEETGEHSINREQAPDGTWKLYRRGYYKAPTGTEYTFRQYPKFIEGQEVYAYKDTQIANYGIQGEAAFLMTVSMGRLMRWMVSKSFFNGKARLINHVHDCCYIDAHESVAREVGLKLRAIMEDTPKYIARKFGWKEIENIPFPADVEWGLNMMEQKHLE